MQKTTTPAKRNLDQSTSVMRIGEVNLLWSGLMNVSLKADQKRSQAGQDGLPGNI